MHGPNSSTCTLQDTVNYWKKKKEKTTSSISNRHIGTYKALIKNEPILNVISGIMSKAYESGVTLPRWTKDLDISLVKKPGKFRPEELRTIGTLEADFNQGAALHFSKRMMHTALQHNAIPASQYAKKKAAVP